jgi:hypothetical protein
MLVSIASPYTCSPSLRLPKVSSKKLILLEKNDLAGIG